MGLAAFAVVAGLDIVWVGYTRALLHKEKYTSSIYAVLIYGFGGGVVISYTSHPWLLLPSIAGAFVGTYVAVRFFK
jgi:hypothetical protein